MRLSDQVAEEQARGIMVPSPRGLPTPTVSDANGPGHTGQGAPGLRTVVSYLPTPTANVASNGGSQPPEKRRAGGHSVSIEDVVEHMLPTPSTSNAHGNRTNSRGEDLLPGAVERLLPTPTATDDRASGGGSAADVTLTDAVVRTELGALPHPRSERLLPTPKAGDADFASGATSGRPVEKSTHLSTIVLLTDGHLEHRRTPSTDDPDEGRLLPTPNASLNGYDADPDAFEQRRAAAAERHGNNGIGMPLGVAVRTLPDETTPAPVDETCDGYAVAWGPYRDAITRTTEVLGRRPPRPTENATKGGKPKLAAPFVEWMMMLDAGHVTDVPGITRAEALRALGNGVVPAQARAATTILIGRAIERVRERRQDRGAR